MPHQRWEEWLAEHDESTRARAEQLRDDFARRGADEPESWARSEIREDSAQMTRYLFLVATWRRMHGAVEDGLNSKAAQSLLSSGTDAATLERVVKQAVISVAGNLCYLLDAPDGTSWQEGGVWRSDIEDRDRRWQLREVDASGALTGRGVGGLHESLGETDPSGNEGEGWWG